MQQRIEDFTNHMSELLRIKRDAELEFTQEELDVFPRPLDDASDPSKPIEFLVNHSQPQQELCDTICNLTTISTSTEVNYLNKENGHQRDAGSTASTTILLGDRILVANVRIPEEYLGNAGKMTTVRVRGLWHGGQSRKMAGEHKTTMLACNGDDAEKSGE
ncbi:hypothetical protein HN51_004864, partial [Arachis hypogaea]